MKLSFLILAHDRPEQAAELALTLVAAARDATAFIHFDVRAKPADFAALAAAVAGEPRVRLVAKRAAGAWGSFGLVEAPLNALAQIEAEGVEPDYVMLLSGACLPSRPVASLERFLIERDGGEFIESEDESWITGGWRAERWRYWHLFDHKTQRPLEAASARIQKLLGVRRSFPAGLEPRFGSQWWTLSWPVLQAILADIRRQPKRLDFFRSVWIPDEMVFQTWVNALVPREAIAGFALTHFQFTNRGKPIVFHDDHADYVNALGRFFVRKVSPEARALRAACLARAAAPDDGRGLGAPHARRDDYKLKIAAQTHYPRPGQIFYADQFVTMSAPVLARAQGAYVVLAGPPALTAAVAAELPRESFTVFGEVFAPGEVDLGEAGPGQRRPGFQGLGRSDVAIRDMHPALWLVRLRARAERVPVLTWSPVNQRRLLAQAVRDPKALVVTLPPSSGDPDRDRAVLLDHCLGPTRRAAERLGVAPERFRAALGDRAAARDPDMALWLVTGAPGAAAPELGAPDIALPWSADPVAAELAARRREALGRALAACRFRDAPWFPGLAAALERAAGRLAEAAAPPAADAGPVLLEDAS
jgi:hypothetical protein